MSSPETSCAFCDSDSLLRESRVIRMTEGVLSIVSNPSMADFHCVILPRKHIATHYAMEQDLRHEFSDEAALLQQAVVNAYEEKLAALGKTAAVSYLELAKPEPTDPQNGVSVHGHLHAHITPLVRPNMEELFPVPRHTAAFSAVHSDILVGTRDAIRRHTKLLAGNS